MPNVCQGCINQSEKYEREVQDLRRQLELANEKISELEVSVQYSIIHTLVKMKFDTSDIVSSKPEDHQTKLFNLIFVTSSIILSIWFVNILNPFSTANLEIYSRTYFLKCSLYCAVLMHINPEKASRGRTNKQAINRREPRESTRNTTYSRIASEVIGIRGKLQS